MKYNLIVGFLGADKESITLVLAEEPLETFDSIVSFFGLADAPGQFHVDDNLLWNVQQKKIWRELNSTKLVWSEMRKTLVSILGSGQQLPMVIDVTYVGLEISIVLAELYFIITSENVSKLQELKLVFEKESDKRSGLYGRDDTKVILEPVVK